MAKLEPGYADSIRESRRKKGTAVPLPYLIRPHMIMPVYKYYSSDDESDEDDPSVKDVETSSLTKDISSGHSLDKKDEEYVVVVTVEAKTETAGAIQMVELPKDTVAESESNGAGSSSDDWVVL